MLYGVAFAKSPGVAEKAAEEAADEGIKDHIERSEHFQTAGCADEISTRQPIEDAEPGVVRGRHHQTDQSRNDPAHPAEADMTKDVAHAEAEQQLREAKLDRKST